MVAILDFWENVFKSYYLAVSQQLDHLEGWF